MQDTMVSIVLPTYNRAYILGRAVESVLNQTYPYFELILVDDGSTDSTQELIENYQDERICYYKLDENGGQSRARNFGIEHARYEYIAFEDSDDIWHPNKLEVQMQLMKHASESVGFCYHKIRYEMEELGTVILPSENIDTDRKSGSIYKQLLYGNLVSCPSVLARKKCLMDVGGFDTSMKSLEDYDLVLKMAKTYQALFVDEVLLEASYFQMAYHQILWVIYWRAASCFKDIKGLYRNGYLKSSNGNYSSKCTADWYGERFIKLIELSLKNGEF